MTHEAFSQGLLNVCRNITGDLSLRRIGCTVAHLSVHLPCVGAASARSSQGAPEPRDREQEHQQRLPKERYPWIHLHRKADSVWMEPD